MKYLKKILNNFKLEEIFAVILLTSTGFIAYQYYHLFPAVFQELFSIFEVPQKLGQNLYLDSPYHKLFLERESWQLFQELLVFGAEKTNQSLSQFFNQLFYVLISISAISSFFVGKAFFKNSYSGVILTFFTILGFPTLWAYNVEFIWILGFTLIWPLTWLNYKLFAAKLNFLATGVLALIAGLLLNFLFFNNFLIITLTSFLLAYSQTYHLSFKQKYTFLWLHLLVFTLFIIGFSGSQSLLLLTESIPQISAEKWTFQELLIFTQQSFFPGIIFVFLGILGALYSITSASNILIFILIYISLMLGFFDHLMPGQLNQIGISAKDLIFGLYFFLLLLVAWGAKFTYQRYGNIISLIITGFIILESTFWINHYNFEKHKSQHDLGFTKLTPSQTIQIQAIKKINDTQPGTFILDDQQLFSDNQWRRAGMQPLRSEQKNEVLNNMKLADFYAVSLVFSENLIQMNPQNFDQIKIGDLTAWKNKQNYQPIMFFPKDKIKQDTPQNIKHKLRNNQIKFNQEIYLNNQAFTKLTNTQEENTQKKLQEFRHKTIFHDKDSWQITIENSQPGILFFATNLDKTDITLNKQSIQYRNINEHYKGIKIPAGNHQIIIKKDNTLIATGKNLFIKTLILFFILFLSENIWYYYKK